MCLSNGMFSRMRFWVKRRSENLLFDSRVSGGRGEKGWRNSIVPRQRRHFKARKRRATNGGARPDIIVNIHSLAVHCRTCRRAYATESIHSGFHSPFPLLLLRRLEEYFTKLEEGVEKWWSVTKSSTENNFTLKAINPSFSVLVCTCQPPPASPPPHHRRTAGGANTQKTKINIMLWNIK